MAFVKEGNFDGFKRDVEFNFNALEDRVIELEKLLKKYNGGVDVEEVVEEEVEEEVVEEEIAPLPQIGLTPEEEVEEVTEDKIPLFKTSETEDEEDDDDEEEEDEE